MIFIDATEAEIDKRVKRVCAPLFATGQFLEGGHDDTAINATVTFVRFESRVYALTCHHVLSAFYSECRKTNRRIVPSIHSGSTVHQFATPQEDGACTWSFVSCRKFATPEYFDAMDRIAVDKNDQEALEIVDRFERANAVRPDIAIADITAVWPLLSKLRDADAIDLSAWIEPDWEVSQPVWLAYGFPDGHKLRRDDKVAAPMPRVSVDLASSRPTEDKPTYKLCSTLSEDHGWGFSGLSGGPVLIAHTSEERYAFVGITYEGAPSAKELEDNPDAFIGKSDIVLSGYHLTPAVFREWLAQRTYVASIA